MRGAPAAAVGGFSRKFGDSQRIPVAGGWFAPIASLAIFSARLEHSGRPVFPFENRSVLALKSFALSFAFVMGFAIPAFALAEEPVDFDAQIQPILSDRCFLCHGPDANKRQADLRLDLEADAKDYAIIPGKPDESELFRRITSDDPAERMPPPKSKLSLTKEEIQLIKRWIEQGAKWQDHWAFNPPRAPAVPSVKNQKWGQNEIDAFILSRIEQAGLTPSEPASRERLIRRVSFDLTGLPPTLEELDEFLKDDSPKAYERLVDRLLQSERFGERLAADWLDAARYSDTYGYQVDRDRFVWPWRDWVIRAFNRNLPYDEFITEQTGGRFAAERHGRSNPGDHVQPAASAKSRRRQRAGGVPHRIRRGPHADLRHRVSGPHARMLPMPRSQVRSDRAEGVLPVLGVFRQHRRSGAVFVFHLLRPHAHAADDGRCHQTKTRRKAKPDQRSRDQAHRSRETAAGSV